MTMQETWILVKTAFNSWYEDYAQSMGAALAYYTMFSIAPLLLIVISIAGMVFGEEAARGEIFGQLHSLMGEQRQTAVGGRLHGHFCRRHGLRHPWRHLRQLGAHSGSNNRFSGICK